MTEIADVPLEPPDGLRFRRTVRLVPALRELWLSRELVRTLAERELRARYKQAVLGFAWAVIMPVIYMLVFTLFFQKVANVNTHGAPYSLFSYLGLLPWTFFSAALAGGGMSLVSNLSLLNKVYCPREVFPIASVATSGFDTILATGILGVLFVVEQFVPKATAIFWVPVLVVVLLAFTLGTVFVVSSLVVYLRDIRHILPLVLQLGLFVTPVAYSMSAVPSDVRWLYALVNPLAPVIDGLRRCVLYGQRPDLTLLGLGALTSTVLLFGGYLMFKRLETGIADVA
jgi:ABC-type polysaccharide/polyol phosphate export permease